MSYTWAIVIAAIISTVGVVLGALIARWTGRGGKRLTDTQRENLTVETAERVVRMQEAERQLLTERVTELEKEVQTLRLKYQERERDLEQSRGENSALRAEVGTLRATLAAREAELAAAKALLSSTPTTVTITGTGPEAPQ